ncbi:MAG: hypothetical protein KKC54_03645 [Nanoarchaeota archaeon]|nr:hypothetical protein [Nanoarchaeota archaeon]
MYNLGKMINPKLQGYTNEKLSMGYSLDTIKNSLIKWGYNPVDVEDTLTSFGVVGKKEAIIHKDKFNFLVNGLDFFKNPNNFELKKAAKYFFYSYLFFFLAHAVITLAYGFFGSGGSGLFLLVMANITTSFLFLAFALVFSAVLAGAFFVSFNWVCKAQINFFRVFSILLISLVPYVIISSIRGTSAYSILTLAGVSLGVFDINAIFLGSLLLFSLGVSSDLGLSFRKSSFYTFAPFFVLFVLIFAVFYSALKFDFLWFSFQKF